MVAGGGYQEIQRSGERAIDSIHIQQVFANLAINSREAIPNGGGLPIGTIPISIP